MNQNLPPAAPEPVSSQQPSGNAQGRSVRVTMPNTPPYVTYTIIGVTVFVYLLQWVSQFLLQFDLPVMVFAKSNELIRAGQLWRFFTPALVHSTSFIAHIGFNMYALFSFGVGLERYFGHKRFLLLYVLGAFTGNVLSFLFSSANSIGASTAVYGLIGAEGVFIYQNRKLLAGQFRSAIGNIIFIVVINLFVIGSMSFIDNWGHIGGLLGGLMFALFASPLWAVEGIQPTFHLVDKRSSREVVVGVGSVLLIFGALAMWGMMR